MWALLFLTLPTPAKAVRLRVWRGLKALGCGAVRDGACVLPAEHGARFEPLAAQVREHGGTASVLDLSPRDEGQRRGIEALFDRSEAYAAWRATAQALQSEVDALAEAEADADADARRRLRSIADALETLRGIDFYPGPAAPPAHGIERLDARRFSDKRWATRQRPWADRLACAWSIRRIVDPDARFLWLADPAAATPTPRGAIGFDVGGIPAPEAPGLETVLAGLREPHGDDDDRFVAAASHVFDALYAAPGASS